MLGHESEGKLADVCSKITKPLYISCLVDKKTKTVWFPNQVIEEYDKKEVMNSQENSRSMGELGVLEIIPGNKIGQILFVDRSLLDRKWCFPCIFIL